MLAVAGVRFVLGLVAIPLAPLLFEEHFVTLVLLRPSKEVLLAGGFLLRDGEVGIVELLVAAVPLLLAGVWIFYVLGRAWAQEIERCEMPGLGGRILPADRIHRMQAVLERRGAGVVVLGRLAAFPSTLVGAAAGSSRLSARTFLLADAAGGLLSFAVVVGAGALLGSAYDEAGPWLTVLGVAVLAAMAVWTGRLLRRE